MAQLKNPNGQLPGGFQFYVSATKWKPAPFSSLDSITNQLISHRRGRPDLVAKFGWSLDPAVVRQEVEQYNVAVAIRQGWSDYIVGGGEVQPPFQPPPPPTLPQRLRNVASGSSTLIEWANEGAPTVVPELANHRAEICVGCPMNGQGGWEKYFTVPVSNAIRAQLERKRNMKLETSFDDKLGVCEGCTCPLPLKIWLPLSNIVDKMPQSQFDALAPDCWIRKERAA
jgi:hypothetical protein